MSPYNSHAQLFASHGKGDISPTVNVEGKFSWRENLQS